jgi:hypothetical protein
MSDQVQDYLDAGGNVTKLKPDEHGNGYISPPRKPPIRKPLPPPSAKSCRHCDNYTRGAGNKKCLACKNYKLMDIEDMRSTITMIPMVSELIEAFPAPSRPDNDLMCIVRQLSAHHAAMISMYYYGALSMREIADVLNIPQVTAAKKLYRAVSDLRKNINIKYPTLKSLNEAKVSDLLSPISIKGTRVLDR